MSITTIPLLRDLQGDWAQLRITLVGPDAPAEPVILQDVFPFLSITDFKRLLWIQQEGNPRWAPERVFVGVRGASGGLRPLEFYWSALVTGGITELPDPLIQPRVPSPVLVDETGARRPIGPTMIGSLTLEAALAPEIAATGELPQIVAISLDALTPAAEESLTPALFGGFYQMYFPWLTAPGEVLEIDTAGAKDAYTVALLYTEDRTGRIAVAQRLLERGVGGDSMTMTTMVRMRWLLPPPAGKPESLERTFYALKASPVLPFLRYFPYGAGTTPLLKLALKADGSPVLDDEKVFAQYLNQPAPTMKSAVILARVPLLTAHAERGTAFTIYMFEDGHSDITLEVPQRGMTYIAAVARDAEKVLAALIPALGFPEGEQARLVDLHATYRWSHPNPQQSTPLSAARIASRISALTPFLDSVPTGKEEKALAVCKWRAVSNYESETEQFAYITQMILRGGGIGDGLSALTKYVADISQRFGITEADAQLLLEQWTERRGSAVAPATGPAAGQWAVPRHAIGALIAISGTHPEYTIEIQNVESALELQRAVSVVGAILGARSADLAITAPAQPIVATANAVSMSNAVQEQMAMVHGAPLEEEAEEEIQFDPAMDDLMAELGFGGAEDIGEEEAVEAAPAAPALPMIGEAPAPDIEAIVEEEGGDACVGTPWKAGEPALKSLDQYYIKRLNEADSVLFGSWKGKAQDMSSVAATGRGKLFSKSCQGVRQPNIMTLAAYMRVRRCYADRVRFIDLPPQKPDDLPRDLAAEAEFFVGKRAARKKNHVEDYLKRMTAEEFLVDKATGKPMWSVFAYENKTQPGEFMYVMCAELWCERDNLPLERGEFEGTQGRGFTKEPNTCPFCGGRAVQDLAAPMSGESVIVRKAKAGAAEPRFIGTMRTRHPAGYELPCCDGTPDLIKGFLRSAIQGETPYEKGVSAAAEEEEDMKSVTTMSVAYKEGAPVDYVQRLSSMHTQYILNYDKALEAGKIGLLPPALDAFFGQNSQRSVESRGIRPTFVKGATVFVRVGVDTRIRTPGLNLFAGLAPLLNFETAEETRAFIKEQITVAAFEAANYGTLVHEFAVKSQLTEDQISGAIQTFASANNYFLDRNRAHVVRVMRAWDAFNRYIDDRTPKQLRHFEHMLAYPGLIQPRGLLLVVLEQVDDQIRIACPAFGIPTASVFGTVPVAFMWHDVRDESWEPIVLYNGTKEAVRFFNDRMQDVPSPQRDAIQSWLADWRSSSTGCGRPAPPPHVWSPNRDTSGLPRLFNLVNWRSLRTRAILRDRSNRLAGVIAEPRAKPGTTVYIPVLDDGSLFAFSRVFEADMIPMAPTPIYIEVYRTLAAQYQALTPTRYLVRGSTTVGFQIANGTMIPLLAGDSGPELPERPQVVDEFPWERDAILLRAPDAPALSAVTLGESVASVEEQLNEAYQHLRLSLSRWLIRHASGPALRSELTKLIDKGLPLYEKRKRMDILLEPVVRHFIFVEQTDVRRSMSLLREDCLSLPESACAAEGACRWSGGRCMIHAPTKDAATADPVRIFTARLSDELLRYTAKQHELLDDNVETIRTPRGVIRVGNELYMSTKPKEAAVTILRRLGFAGQVAITFPEEMLRFDGLEEGEAPLPPPEEDEVALLTRRDLPASWTALGFEVPMPPSGVENAKQLAFAEGTGKTIEEWTKFIQLRRKKFGLSGDVNRPFQWSIQDFYVIAIITLCSIVFVRQTKEGQLIVDRWINPPGAKGMNQQFIVFWGPQQLLVTRGDRYRFMLNDLPPELRAALDTTSPMTEEEARGTLEEIASPPASDEGSPASSVISGESDIMPALGEIGGAPSIPQPAASMENEEGQAPAPQYATSIEGISLA